MYKLPILPYLYQGLEPFIDTHTMALHYHGHEQAYLDNLNNILKKNNFNSKYDLIELSYHINEFPIVDRENLLFNLGGVLNHNLYWKSMSKDNKLPTGLLINKINSQYGGYEEFWDLFNKRALSLKGSGYTVLVLKKDGDLDIVNFFNQDIPYLYEYIPLFNIDLWEHAYYLNYKNDKAKYINNFKKVADFTNASYMFENAMTNYKYLNN